jgi:hypothetical protein|tara:strand:+ start:48 stop:431 length:384 start_codon:yes stop_codon:yes gene_type:complete
MQQKSQLQDLRHLRAALRRLLTDLERSLQVVCSRTPLVKGNVYEMARKCGKRSCPCTRGRLHRTWVLSWSEQGKTRLLSIPAGRLAELQEKSVDYLRFRRARARVSESYREILALLDRIEKLRREAP